MATLTVPVSFRWSGPPGQKVELVGDFPDWKYPRAMPELSSGLYACELELEAGVYRYKYRVNGHGWMRDPSARLIDHADVFENNLLVVGGTTPPVVFAPDRRHLAFFEDGRAIFHVEVADPAFEPSHVWIQDDPKEPRRRVFAPLKLEASRGEWRLLKAEAQLAPARSKARPVFGFSGAPEQVFQLPEPRGQKCRPPAWLDGAVLYTIFVDRWLRGASSAPMPQARSRRAPTTAQTFYGGDLHGIREGLPYLQDLGVTAVVLSPIHCSPTPHRYDSTDLLAVDAALGGEAALGKLVEAVHARGMRLVLDVAATHVNEAHPAFADVLARQQRSRFCQWFRLKRFPVVARDTSTFENYYDRPELPWLDLREGGPARKYVFKAVERLIDAGVDGLRLDAMDDAPASFWQELRARARARNPELLLMGEVVSDSPARYAEERGIDLATDFRHREAMLAFFARGAIDAEEFWARVVFDRFRSGPFDASFHLAFLDNHDTARFLSMAVLYDRLRLALAYLLLRPEPVALTYGTEMGLAGSDPERILDDAWPERLPMPALDGPPNQTQVLLRELTRLRRQWGGLLGPPRRVRSQGRLLVLERYGPDLTLRAYLNASDETVTIADIPDRARLLLSINDPGASVSSPLPACAGRIFLVPGPPPVPA
ncbi:MAG: hypothetical protein HY901_35905 [Deltaproteobacteria bacterium]|nr:hypothetical protein [Deltaproteobacteria bacterium]